MKLDIYVDASCSKNGYSKYGYIILQHTTILAEGNGYYPGDFSSVPAEHIAVDMAYRITKIFCRRLKEKIEGITLFTDSEIFFKESYRRPMFLKALSHVDGQTEQYHIPIQYKWIPSEDNLADILVSQRNSYGKHCELPTLTGISLSETIRPRGDEERG